MAISFNTGNSYGFSMLPLFGVSKAMCDAAKDYDVVVEQTSPGTFVVRYGSKVYGTIPIKGSAITLAKAGQLGPASKSAIEFQFKKALEAALKDAKLDAEQEGEGEEEEDPVKIKKVPVWSNQGTVTGKTSSSSPNLSNIPKSEFDTLSGIANMLNSDSDSYKPLVDAITGKDSALKGLKKMVEEIDLMKASAEEVGQFKPKPLNVSAATALPVVKLEGASAIYQKVFGTSSGSVYFMLAEFSGCNMAVRLKGSVLSVRFEGQGMKKYSAAFDDLGIANKGTYASQHFQVGNLSLALKTFGAIISRMGMSNLLAAGDLSAVEGL